MRNIFFCFLFIICVVYSGKCIPPAISKFIKIDQFGYRTGAIKTCIVSNPKVGFNSGVHFSPSLGLNQYQVVRLSDNATVYSGQLVAWNGGATDAASGDATWWFDFSSVTAADTYYILDVGKNMRSYSFKIADDVYKPILKAAMRMFYYNRSGCNKTIANAGANWADGPALTGPLQETQARSVTDPTNNATMRDVSGGWFDAGDRNKYVTYVPKVIDQLLFAYNENPTVFTDDFNIPESGNGLPDIIDEIKWELDFLKKMQNADGSCILKVGMRGIDYSNVYPASMDHISRYYIPDKSTAATIACCSMFAHAAKVFKTFPSLAVYAADLQTRAVSAWTYYITHAQNTFLDDGTLMSGNADMDFSWQNKMQVVAAVYLYDLTGNVSYKNYVDANYAVIDVISNHYWDFWNHNMSKALLHYASLSSATTSTASAIKNEKLNSTGFINYYGYNKNLNAYRSFFSSDANEWGRNQWCADIGNINKDVANYTIVSTGAQLYRDRGEDIIHQFHGVNAFGIVYLSNMSSYGSGESVNAIYHDSYPKGSPWENALSSAKGGPPPGYVPGGPYTGYTDDNGACTLAPPCNQPEEKSYRQDFNDGWPADSWSIAEPAIYYQSAYVELLSGYILNNFIPLPLGFESFTATKQNNKTVLLQWQIVNRNDIKTFVLERSPEARKFTAVATINNHQGGLFNYSDDYSNVNGDKLYYRIKLVMNTGKEDYSETRVVSFNVKSEKSISILHSTPEFLEVLTDGPDRARTAELYDFSGKPIYKETFIAGTREIKIPCYGLKEQVLIIKVDFEDGSFITRKYFLSK